MTRRDLQRWGIFSLIAALAGFIVYLRVTGGFDRK